MSKSIMQEDRTCCYLCKRNGSSDPLEEHHIFGGANRKLSERDGLKVCLCGSLCHRNGIGAVHKNKQASDRLKAEAQKAWEERYGTRGQFVKRYGRNYL